MHFVMQCPIPKKKPAVVIDVSKKPTSVSSTAKSTTGQKPTSATQIPTAKKPAAAKERPTAEKPSSATDTPTAKKPASATASSTNLSKSSVGKQTAQAIPTASMKTFSFKIPKKTTACTIPSKKTTPAKKSVCYVDKKKTTVVKSSKSSTVSALSKTEKVNPKPKTTTDIPATSKAAAIHLILSNDYNKLYCLFLQQTIKQFNILNKELQKEVPQVHLLSQKLNNFLKGIMLRFAKPEIIKEATSLKE